MPCIVVDLSSWNGSISQRWRRLRRCCASLRASSAQNNPEPCRDALIEGQNKHILVSTPHGSSSLRLPSSKKGSVQEVLRSKLNRIHVGLRKRRALSVQEVFSHEQPTFYVPSPDSGRVPGISSDSESTPNDCDSAPAGKPAETHRSRSRTRRSVDSSAINDYGYHSCDSQGYDSLPFEPEPDYDDVSSCPRTFNASPRRWSVVDGLMRYNPQSSRSSEAPVPPPRTVSIEKATKLNLEAASGKIPKAKLSGKHQERARSHSPSKKSQKEHTKSSLNIAKKAGTAHSSVKVAPSKSHYEFTTIEQRPEVNQNDYGRINKEHRQVRNIYHYIRCKLTICLCRSGLRSSKRRRKRRRRKKANFARFLAVEVAPSRFDRFPSRRAPDLRRWALA